MKENFLGKKVLIVTAHPDDESFLAGGSIFANAETGGKNFLVCATLGGKGSSHLKKPVSESKLEKIRGRELSRAAKFLQIKKVFTLGLKDGTLVKYKILLQKKIQSLVRQIRPEAIVGFGEDGYTGHLDHITTGQAAKSVAKSMRVPYYSFAVAPKFRKMTISELKKRRRSPFYRDKLFFPIPNVKINIDPKIKIRAIRFHATQYEGRNPLSELPKLIRQEFLRHEYFFLNAR